MKAIWLMRHGTRGALTVRETPDPRPGAGEVRVRVRAAGLNFSDISARKGFYPDAPKPPCVLGYEGAGVIDAVGEGVGEHVPGDRVLFLSRFGAHADTVVVPVEQAMPMPEGMSFEEGAALSVNYVTAYHALFRIARIRPGEHVLVHMAAGGVGTALLQLCRTVEGVVTYGTASAGKHDHLRANGCHHPIDYRTESYVDEVLRLTDGRGVDAVFDPLGGKDWRRGYRLLRPTGMLVCLGMANTNVSGRRGLGRVLRVLIEVPRFSARTLLDDNKAVAGVNVGHLWGERAMIREELHAVLDLYRAGAIAPHIHRAFPFSRADEAWGEIEHGRNVGKVVLVPDD